MITHKSSFTIKNISFFCFFVIVCTSFSLSGADSTKARTGGVFDILSGKKKGNRINVSKDFDPSVLSSDSAGGLSGTTIPAKDKVKLSYFTIVPKTVPITEQKETAYRSVIEEARQKIAVKYKTAVDTIKSNANYNGDITVKVFLDGKGKVKSCKIDGSSVKTTEFNKCVVSSVKELDFGPVWHNKKVKGMIFRFSFNPLAESR